jgi:hypothetical protein
MGPPLGYVSCLGAKRGRSLRQRIEARARSWTAEARIPDCGIRGLGVVERCVRAGQLSVESSVGLSVRLRRARRRTPPPAAIGTAAPPISHGVASAPVRA